jgi:hypothetical protein
LYLWGLENIWCVQKILEMKKELQLSPCDFDQSDKIISYDIGVKVCRSHSNRLIPWTLQYVDVCYKSWLVGYYVMLNYLL